MYLTVTPITPRFGARVTGVDLNAGLTDALFAEIKQAFETYSVLVLPGQPMTDEQQIEFSQRFGPMEMTDGVNPGSGTPFARQSNLDIKSGAIIDKDDRRIDYQKANMLWHADSTFKSVPSLCSLLSARVVPPEGGATEFASTRGAWEALPPERQKAIEGLTVEHDFVFSRGRKGFKFTPEEAAKWPPARHTLVVTNPTNGRKALLIGAHAARIVGMKEAEGTALLDELLELATTPENTFSHAWTEGDLVIWDNRAALHRATPFDNTKHKRLMQRITISTGVPNRQVA